MSHACLVSVSPVTGFVCAYATHVPAPRLTSSMTSATGITSPMACQSVTPPILAGSTFCARVCPLCGSMTKAYLDIGVSGTMPTSASVAALPSRSYSSM